MVTRRPIPQRGQSMMSRPVSAFISWAVLGFGGTCSDISRGPRRPRHRLRRFRSAYTAVLTMFSFRTEINFLRISISSFVGLSILISGSAHIQYSLSKISILLPFP